MIRYIYSTSNFDRRKELVIEQVITKAKKFLDLPNTIEVEFKNLNNSIYAETLVDPRFTNRIRLNANINYNSLVEPTVHELLHLNQIFTGKLSCNKGKIFIWENKTYKIDQSNLTYEDYQNLPWELDVKFKEKKLLNQILNS